MNKTKKINRARKIAIGALAVTMSVCTATSQILAYADKGAGVLSSNETVRELSFNNLTGSVDLSNVTLSQLSDRVTDYGAQAEQAYFNGTYSTKTVIVSLDTPSIVESMSDDDTVADFLLTSKGRSAVSAINNSQHEFLRSLSASAISYKVVNKYSTVINAVEYLFTTL